MPLLKRTKKPAPALSEVEAVVASVKPTKQKASAKAGKVDVAKEAALRVILRPLSTEKLAHQGKHVYGFRVALAATKVEVMKAVQVLYGVRPARVNVLRMEGKTVRFGRSEGKHSDWKKAIVYLKAGEHIDVHAGV